MLGILYFGESTAAIGHIEPTNLKQQHLNVWLVLTLTSNGGGCK